MPATAAKQQSQGASFSGTMKTNARAQSGPTIPPRSSIYDKPRSQTTIARSVSLSPEFDRNKERELIAKKLAEREELARQKYSQKDIIEQRRLLIERRKKAKNDKFMKDMKDALIPILNLGWISTGFFYIMQNWGAVKVGIMLAATTVGATSH